jgi:hypothetical protein
MNGIKVPGVLYSLLLAVGAWAIDYFSNGAGVDVPWAPILIATIPVILKMFTVQAPATVEPQAMARGEVVEQPSKMKKFLFG